VKIAPRAREFRPPGNPVFMGSFGLCNRDKKGTAPHCGHIPPSFFVTDSHVRRGFVAPIV